ncbi:MAG: tRNA (adenosine(37)-N6)-threonylcarbamoyltransferase complex dimerization subunit type 1 TsaB [Candidatus Levybacteria bacterium]|nr:tRNA (adenosine(37)-N6)-threonylcarbamoyltransferase complex dimerization subunit type 1 TsaB [Candidatus Levybacteria bacterium]
MNTLIIDTSSNKEIKIGLKINRGKYVSRKKIGLLKAQVALPMIEKLLMQNSLTPRDMDEIQVSTGPGSFTGLRVGISIANALGFFLKIPINKQRVGKLAQPRYK